MTQSFYNTVVKFCNTDEGSSIRIGSFAMVNFVDVSTRLNLQIFISCFVVDLFLQFGPYFSL